jgi:NADH:ubiquinone reductase (H+-translocating)
MSQGATRLPFRYHERGAMATIGRARAIADFGRIKLSGFVAWIVWVIVHIYFLIGFEDRVLVMIQWIWAYLTQQRGNRLITYTTSLPQHAAAELQHGQITDAPGQEARSALDGPATTSKL